MQPLKAHVRNGRLVLDEPTDRPEGAEVQLTIVDDDEMSDEERARLHAALERSMAQAKAGKLIDADEVIGRLLSRE
jgi:predicted transcriptional regulator